MGKLARIQLSYAESGASKASIYGEGNNDGCIWMGMGKSLEQVWSIEINYVSKGRMQARDGENGEYMGGCG